MDMGIAASLEALGKYSSRYSCLPLEQSFGQFFTYMTAYVEDRLSSRFPYRPSVKELRIELNQTSLRFIAATYDSCQEAHLWLISVNYGYGA